MIGSQRALMALQMFESAQQIVLSSLDPALSEQDRRREPCRRFYADELACAIFPLEATKQNQSHGESKSDAVTPPAS